MTNSRRQTIHKREYTRYYYLELCDLSRRGNLAAPSSRPLGCTVERDVPKSRRGECQRKCNRPSCNCLGYPCGTGQSWSRLSEQNLRVDKWSVCRVRLPSGGAAG